MADVLSHIRGSEAVNAIAARVQSDQFYRITIELEPPEKNAWKDAIGNVQGLWKDREDNITQFFADRRKINRQRFDAIIPRD